VSFATLESGGRCVLAFCHAKTLTVSVFLLCRRVSRVTGILLLSLHGWSAPPYPLQDFKALYKCCIIIIIIARDGNRQLCWL